jgi:hypothetical protein
VVETWGLAKRLAESHDLGLRERYPGPRLPTPVAMAADWATAPRRGRVLSRSPMNATVDDCDDLVPADPARRPLRLVALVALALLAAALGGGVGYAIGWGDGYEMVSRTNPE